MFDMRLIGFQELEDQLRGELRALMPDGMVTVGIHEDAGMAATGELTMATLGAIQEFGTETIPARPWLVPGVESATQEILDTIQEGIEEGRDPAQTLNRVGLVAAGEVQMYITELRTPPNAPSTIAAKGSDNPLIDTGAMRASVTYQIQRGPMPEEGLE